MSQNKDAKSYKATLNLPKTAFPMKANLVQNEPQTLKSWQKNDLYNTIRENRKDSPKYHFHDGPPYANGSIHLGHLLNKVLKDIVVRVKTLEGYDVPYVPGWDCHGLPIEHKVMQDLGDKAKTMTPIQIRRKCKTYAEKFVKLQSSQMQRLLTLADYKNPYLTMNPAFEASVLEVFSDLVSKDIVYRALKPVHWSIANQTALAEAELEYEDREDTSVYVLFKTEELSQSLGAPDGMQLFFMIWTTTPWTLPANLAIAVHERYMYGLYPIQVDDQEVLTVIATEMAEKVLTAGGHPVKDPLAVFTGEKLLGASYRHPFIDRIGTVVTADYVTLEDGSGLVHTAPGHGTEDYQTGLRYRINMKTDDYGTQIVTTDEDGQTAPTIYCPVLADGTFDDTAPDFLQGKIVWDANDLVVEKLKETNSLFLANKFMHSYPHDWRSKTPVIFRATDQWFIGVEMPIKGTEESLKSRALKETAEDVTFYPDWGKNRMRGMLESRPDWCISRQRAWGLPIPAFQNPAGQTLMTAASVKAIADKIREHGSDAWFIADANSLLENYDYKNDADAPDWVTSVNSIEDLNLEKLKDIFDVWFESGSSWNAVMRQRGLARPQGPTADLYLEGSDQHRGWFQLSLLPSLGVTGFPPFKSVFTHSFTVDRHGKKISKSDEEQKKHIPQLDELLKEYGADICRWWVGSLNTDHDIKVDKEYFKLAGEEYRKVRNTLRFLMSNLNDFNFDTDQYSFSVDDATSIDAWAIGEFNKLTTQVRSYYEKFQFRKAHEALFHFCNETLSSTYLTTVKDRLYCDSADAPRRRRCQTAMYLMLEGFIKLISPFLPHTSEEAWKFLHGENGLVHTQTFPDTIDIAIDENWENIIDQRTVALKVIEKNIPKTVDAKGKERKINPLDIGVTAAAPTDHFALLQKFPKDDLADMLGVSRFDITQTSGTKIEYSITDLRDQPRCDRSWKRDSTVSQRSDGGLLTNRDAQALGI